MKVGILTYHCSYNFGANLQALAVQSTLNHLGVDCEIINYREPYKMRWYREDTVPEQAQAHEEFMKRHFQLSPELTRAEDIEAYCRDGVDAVFVGSDAVFRIAGKYNPRQMLRRAVGRKSWVGGDPALKDRISPYWLDWEEADEAGPRKCSIAASAEASEYYYASPALLGRVRRCLDSFEFLSVRDRWTAAMVRVLSMGTASPVLCPDPVFALKRTLPSAAAKPPVTGLEKTVLLSGKFAGSWREAFVEAAHARGLQVANLPNPDNVFDFPESDRTLRLPMDPLEWYHTIGEARAFVGIRFHALVCSLTNGTPAMALDSPPKGDVFYRHRSKVYDLCRRAGVPGRYQTVPGIQEREPGQLLDHLLETPADQTRADQYARRAEDDFVQVVSAALAAAEIPSGEAQPV